MPLAPVPTAPVDHFFTPDYFSPYYFAPLAKSGTGETGGSVSSQFFAPTYFSPFYFPPLLLKKPDTPPAEDETTYGDRDAFRQMTKALKALGVFADVIFGTTADRRPSGADATPVLVVTPVGWEETDEVDPTELLRRVFFKLTVVVRDEDPLTRFEQLDELSSLVQDAVDGSDLGGGALPALTTLRRGTYDANPIHPEQRATLHGEFSYLIQSAQGHSAAR